MSISPNITRRALLSLASALALLPLTGCETATPATADAPKTGIDELPLEEGELLVPSDHSPISGNAAWCAPMQICWHALENDFNGGGRIPEDNAPDMVHDLNYASFEDANVGEDHYVTYVGQATYDAKAVIEALIKERFDQESDILDMLEWSDDPLTDLFIIYCMLYREFTFGHAFDTLDKAPFGSEEGGNLVDNVAYFGADENSHDGQGGQVIPLFWDSDERFAVRIMTNEGDELVLARGAVGSDFKELWDDVRSNSDWGGRIDLQVASFACPKLSVDVLNKYDELVGFTFINTDGDPITIGKALQSLRFKLDEKGGTIKSEAAIEVLYGGGPVKVEAHDFRFDDSFVLFLVDTNASLRGFPYAALKVDNIEDFV